MTFAALGLVCSDTGTVKVSQSGATFSATGLQAGSCTQPGAPPQEFTLDLVLAEGVVAGSAVSFSVDTCPYQGAVSGDSIVGTISCIVDFEGTSVRGTGTWRLVPPPPTVLASMAYPAGDTLAVPGDVVGVRVQAQARRALAWVGYEVGAPISLRDSVQVTGHEVEHRFDITAPAQAGAAPITVFARDVSGGQSRPVVGNLVVLGNLIRRPTRSLLLSAPVRDLAVDPRRNRVYLSQTASQRIVAVDLATGEYGPAITTPFGPAGIDLTPGGDSLIIASAVGANIGIVNLATATPTVATRALASEHSNPDVTWVGDRLRVMANHKVMVTLTYAHQFSCCQGWLSEYDLATGTTELRTDGGSHGGSISHQEPLARAGDGSRLLLVEACCTPLHVRTYFSATDTFGPLTQVVVEKAPLLASADAVGDRFLIANAVFDADLQPVITFDQPEYEQGGATVLSPDGSVAYLAIYEGYLKVRVSDGAVLERVRLPRWSMAFAVTADGNTLIAASGTAHLFESNELLLMVDLR